MVFKLGVESEKLDGTILPFAAGAVKAICCFHPLNVNTGLAKQFIMSCHEPIDEAIATASGFPAPGCKTGRWSVG